jgi:chemosensory pili system protein ChpA (sensor histidine kinase/response regulator)
MLPTPTPEPEATAGDDLSALAWVQGELRRSLDTAHKALRRYVKEAEAVVTSDVDAVDPAVLRTARVQIHQGVGALELVGLPVVAQVLRASEAAVQRLIARPKLATPAAVETIEQVSFAVLDFLGRVLSGKTMAPLALFPQYAAVQALAGAERVHPADLWPQDWQWRQLPRDAAAVARAPDDHARGEMEYLTLALMRGADRGAQRRMSELCAELGAGTGGEQATLWQLAAAFFEGQAAGLIAPDLHTKRVGSRLLAQLRAAVRGQADVSDRLAQDLLFFCVRAVVTDAAATPRLAALQSVWPGDAAARADYETPRLGLHDPALILQARKRVASAKDAWSAVAGGEMQRLAGLGESFALLGDSVQRLFPGGEVLAQALQATVARVMSNARPPAPELAMEVATAVLYLDAVLEDGELDQPVLGERVQRLAQRIVDVGDGTEAQPLEHWMEELYRRISDRQTMGSVVHELRASLSEVEKQIDHYFRNPAQREVLIPVPAQLSSMRGVLSVLGMDQASQAVLHMRDDVDALAQTEVDPQRAVQAGTFDRLADNLGALSFLIDMLSVQPQLAKTLFRFDPDAGSLSAVMGQSARVSAFAAFEPTALESVPTAVVPMLPEPPPATPPPVAASGLEDDAEMREIFLEEAREVIAGARASLARLAQASDDLNEMTSVRRAFHTLKGSSRMVGLKPFGEAAWACEQLYNARLAQSARMDAPLQGLSEEALDYLADWVEAIAAGQDLGHRHEVVSAAADALRLEDRRLAIVPAGAAVEEEPEPEEQAAAAIDVPEISSLAARVPDLPSAADLELPTLALPAEETQAFTLDFDLPPEPAAEPEPDLEPLSLPEITQPLPPAGDEAVFELDLGALETPADDEQPLPTEAATLAEPEAEVVELSADDFAFEFELPGEPPPEPQPIPEPEPEPEPVPETDASAQEDDSVKLVGDLRIAIPLFNIFLNEADEQSRRLGTEIAEWTLEPQRAIGDAAIALAHSLAGNSGTVGFTDLSLLARALEHALMRSRAIGHASEGESELFTDAAEEIRRLLHQFAAGFLKPVNAELMLRLADHEIATSNPERDTESPELEEYEAIALAPESAFVPESPPAPPSEDGEAEDQDLDAVDAIDHDLFPIFEEEADELLPQLRARLAEWVRHPSDLDAAAACMRTLHTFKGGARLAGAMRVGELAHRLETEIERLSARDEIKAAEVERLLARADGMATSFERVRRPAPAATPAATPVPMPPPAEPAVREPVPAVAQEAVTEVEATVPLLPTPMPAAPETPAFTLPPERAIDWARFAETDAPELPAAAAEAAPASGAGATVRVRAPLLDRLVNQAGEVSITRARIESNMHTLQGSLEDLTENLDKLRRHLRDIELQAETQISSRMEAAKAAAQGFDPLEMDRFTRFQELTRMMAESVNDVATVQRGLQRALQSSEDELAAQARLTRELQDDLLRTRMVEFESLADRLYRVVRQAAKETGKAVRLDITGGSIEVDRGVLERMVGPFEHLLRNSVAHGIEPAPARHAAGKGETGTIAIVATQEGNEVAVEVRDDGAGLDLARIRARAVERGLIAADATPSDADLAQMIFLPGFSTAETVSGLAGRGVGMDVVRAEVNAMGGRIETLSDPGRGTTFRLLLPLTTAVTQVVMLRFGERQVAVPSTLVEVVKRAKADEVEQCYASGEYRLGDAAVPFFWLGALLQAEGRGGNAERSQIIVVLRSAAQRVAVHVDEVVGNQEVVVKNLGPALSRLPGLAGITLLPSGAVAMIYNPVALATVYGDDARARVHARAQPDVPEADAGPVAKLSPLVMVVDDSLTVRRVTQRLLVREGYRVVLAKDGMEALERLAEERPAVLLSDIEMPRMDGFDLVRNVRADTRLADLPVIMITSRIAQKHRDYAAELGVDHYLGKPYSEDELLGLVARHVGADIAL